VLAVLLRTCSSRHACCARAHWGEEGWGLTLRGVPPVRLRLTVGAHSWRGHDKKVLVIGSDTMTSVLDYRIAPLCALRDGAGAVLRARRFE